MNTTCSEFSPSANKAGGIAVDTFFEHFKDNHNPFDFSIEKVINFVTGKFIDPDLTENLIHSITIGDGVHSVFKSSRLEKRTVKLFDPITRTKVAMKSVEEMPEAAPTDDISVLIIFDVMAYFRKVPVKKLKLRTYEDFVLLMVHFQESFK